MESVQKAQQELAMVKAQARDLRTALVLEKARGTLLESELQRAQLRVSELEMALDLARSKAMGKE